MESGKANTCRQTDGGSCMMRKPVWAEKKKHKTIQPPHCFGQQDWLQKHKGVYQWCNVVHENWGEQQVAPRSLVTVSGWLTSMDGESNNLVTRRSNVVFFLIHVAYQSILLHFWNVLTPWSLNCNIIVYSADLTWTIKALKQQSTRHFSLKRPNPMLEKLK